MTVTKRLALNAPVSIAPLVSFRILFGLLMFLSLLRFWWRGWIDAVYIKPSFHFTYTGFDWVKPLGDPAMYLLFATIILAALFVALGLFYRIAIIVFFLGFTYVELIDVTTYLNHYYFISLVAFIMIWLPANRDYSLDVWRKPDLRRFQTARWTIGLIRLQLAIVYIFAGLAKINEDWLLNAEPMRTWLPAKSHLPIVGTLMYEEWVAYLFSWFGAAYDLFIVFFLLNKRTRLVAFIFVVLFHVATAIFFPGIGMFPYVMILSTTVFFSGAFHERLLSKLPYYHRMGSARSNESSYEFYRFRPLRAMLAVYIFAQVVIPLRFLLYPGHLFWHEEGYRFSWRVMLMEKAGAAYFTVRDKTGKKFHEVDNKAFLTPLQEKMMSTQPDMIVRYAHYLSDVFHKRGFEDPEVYAEVYVALNGRRSRLFIDSSVNLAKQNIGWRHYDWVLPFNKE